MNKNGRVVLKSVFVASIILSVLFLSFVLAGVIVGSPNVVSFNQTIPNMYNISINDTGVTADLGNITNVSITLPDTFVFVSGTNYTDAGVHVFNYTNLSGTAILNWWNVTRSLVNNLTTNYFSFYANASTPGTYYISINVTNSTNTNNTLIKVVINDTIRPVINFTAKMDATGKIVNRSDVVVNATATDSYLNSLRNITLFLYNSTWLNITVNNTATGFANHTYANFTGLRDGVYYYYAAAYDLQGNNNNTETRNITLDTRIPWIVFNSGTADTGSNLSQSSISVNLSVIDSSELNITFMLFNITSPATADSVNTTSYIASGIRTMNWTGLKNGNYTYNVTIFDVILNMNYTETRAVILDTVVPSVTTALVSNTGTSITLSVTASDSLTGVNLSSCTVTPDYGEVTVLTTSTFTVSGTGLACGSSYSIIGSCKDYAGNLGADNVHGSFSTDNCGSLSSGGGGGTATVFTNTYTIDDQQFASGYEKQLGANDQIKFSIDSESHHVGVLSMTNNSATVEIASTVQTVSLNVGETKKVEVNGDGYYDLSVTLNSISGGKADITLKSIHEAVPAGATGAVTNASGTQTTTPSGGAGATSSGTIVWIVVALIVIIVIAVWIGYRKKRRR